MATCLGPVLAVALTLGFTYWRETSGAKYNRRLAVFRILMAARRVGISPEHVNALNLVEVDFHGCAAVEAEWKVYKNHLHDDTKPEDAAWRNKKEKLLATPLFEIAKVLKFNIPVMEIFEGGYAPSGWEYRDMRYTEALEYINELREGKKILPLWLCGVTPPPSAPNAPPVSPLPSEG